MAFPPEPYPPAGRPLAGTGVVPPTQHPPPHVPPTQQPPHTAPWGAGGPPGAPSAPWQVRPQRRGSTVWAVLGILVAAVALLVSVTLIAVMTGPGAAFVGAVVALVPLVGVLLGIRWIDRWEPEPRGALIFAFLWGAGVSTLVSLLVNTMFTEAVFISTGSVETAELVGASVIAPLVEETAKGVGVLVLFLARRRYFDGPVDGLVYAATVAAGFAFVENILYFGRSIEVLPQIFIMRGLMSPFAHVLFTAAIGIALGIAARSRSRNAWLLALPVGWLVAVALHALWNGSTFTDAFFGMYLLVQLPLFACGIVIILWLRRSERRIIEHRLVDYARAGWFAPHEVAMLSSFPARRTARRWAGRGGPGAVRDMKVFQRAATDLAFLRQRAATGRAQHDFPHEERALLERVTGSRAAFLRTVAGARA
ncbi:PrsW family intramembrane metalloprotease [Georgenia sp. MJ170]|uniref:PrsW family intramembrane metalloprotease n=1 Tax=Georgenia sunbinii TaxID=3117728 RepID=UPI002F26CBFF